MKAWISVIPMIVAAHACHAAWFCDANIGQFALERLTHEQAAANRAFLDIDSGHVIRGSVKKEDVDGLAAWLTSMKAWATSLDDGCVRDAYLKWIEAKKTAEVDVAYRALEFMKTPRPGTLASGM